MRTLDQLCLDVSVDKTKSLFGSGNISIGQLFSAALIVCKLWWQSWHQLKVVFFFVGSVRGMTISLHFWWISCNGRLVLLYILFQLHLLGDKLSIISTFSLNRYILSPEIKCLKCFRCLLKNAHLESLSL